MATRTIRAPDGRTFYVDVPQGVSADAALAWAQARADSWQDGGHYTMHPMPAPRPASWQGAAMPASDGDYPMPAPRPAAWQGAATPAPAASMPVPTAATWQRGDYSAPAVEPSANVRYRTATAPDGRQFTVRAPADASDDDVIGYVQQHADSWEPGRVYDMRAPRERTRNERADEAVQLLNARMAEIIAERQQVTRGAFADTDGGAAVGFTRPRMADPATREIDQRRVRELDAEYRDLEAQRDKLTLGSTGQTVGGVGGALSGGAIGAGIGSAVLPGVGTVVGGTLGAILGAAAGTAAGTHLYDIPEARKARDITDAEAAELIKSRAIESVVFDGAFLLLFGPGGKLVGRLVGGQKLLPAIKATGADALDWTRVKDFKDAVAREQRADFSASVSRGTDPQTQQATDFLTAQGATPTRAQVGRKPSGLDRAAEWAAPGPYAEQREAVAAGMDRALLARQGRQHTLFEDAGDLTTLAGENLAKLQSIVVRETKRQTAPAFEAARKSGIVVDLSRVDPATGGSVRSAIENALRADAASAGRLLKAHERADFEQLLAAAESNPRMSAEASQDFISGNKSKLRAITDGTPASPLYSRILGAANDAADKQYLDQLHKVSPDTAEQLRKARDDYRTMHEMAFGDDVERALGRTPERVIENVTRTGNVSEIDAVDNLLKRAAGLNPDDATFTHNAVSAAERIRSAMLDSFLRREAYGSVENLAKFNSRLRGDDKLRRTFDRLKVFDPQEAAYSQTMSRAAEIATKNGTAANSMRGPAVILGGGAFGGAGGAIIGGITGGFAGAAVGLSLAGLARALAVARTHPNKGVLRALQRIHYAITQPGLVLTPGQKTALAESLREAAHWAREQNIELIVPTESR